MLVALVAALSSVFKTRAALQLENLALRHQLGVLHRSVKKPKLTPLDRVLWAWLCGVWADWRSALIVVKPETVIAWHRKGFRLGSNHCPTGQPSATMPVIANTGATLLIGHESAMQRLGLSCRTSSCTKISNAQPIAKFLAPVTSRVGVGRC